jgi:hypothetical protein
MGIGDLFKRFKRNAAALEEYREGMAQPQKAGESQAERAHREGEHTPQRSASPDQTRSGDD